MTKTKATKKQHLIGRKVYFTNFKGIGHAHITNLTPNRDYEIISIHKDYKVLVTIVNDVGQNILITTRKGATCNHLREKTTWKFRGGR